MCDCHLRWIPSFLDNPATRPLFYDFGACSGPVSNLTGVSVDTLTNEGDFECSELNDHVPDEVLGFVLVKISPCIECISPGQ